MKYVINLKYVLTASTVVEANSIEEAEEKYADCEYGEIENDEELYGGIPWDLEKIEKLEEVKK